jgi:transglutaminase-like putative cysteine protease
VSATAARVEDSARSVQLTYSATIGDLPTDADTVLVWIPLPSASEHQDLHSWKISDGYPHSVEADDEYGNRFAVIRIDGADIVGRREIPVTFVARVTRRGYRVDAGSGPAHAGRPWGRFLQPDRLVPIDGSIAVEAQRVAAGAPTPLERASLLYHHVVNTMAYDKSGDGWGRGDALYACDIRTGNCTDFHSLFIAQARALDIPARFVMGLPLPADRAEGEIFGYHCWAEFFVEDIGWVPVDASEAYKHPEKRDFFFGGLDPHRVQFTTGRDIALPGATAGPLNYVIYPHVEVDGNEHLQVESIISFRSL